MGKPPAGRKILRLQQHKLIKRSSSKQHFFAAVLIEPHNVSLAVLEDRFLFDACQIHTDSEILF
jgi:hypothetical protein